MSKSNQNARHAALRIVRELRHAGHLAYFAGGCVRDELLGLEPTDYDIATDATPERIRKLFARTAHVGAAFGVVLVTVGSRTIEVATFRDDGPYSDRRRPDSVTFSNPESDARRRDFTVNALFLDPEAKPNDADLALGARGHVIDLVNGLADLQAKILRAVGKPEERLAEDHLRALRAVRFAARLDFAVEDSTAEAIRAHASDLVGVSRERVGDELRRILKPPSRSRGIKLLSNLQLDSPVFNEPPHPGPWPVFEALPETECPFPLTLASLAVDRHGQDLPVESVVRRWRSALMLSNDERDALQNTLTLAIKLRTDWTNASVAQRKRWASTTHFEWALHLNCLQKPLIETIQADVQTLSKTHGGLCPTPLVDGQVLMDAGLVPGPTFGHILHTLYNLQLEGQITTKTQAIAKARELEADSSV